MSDSTYLKNTEELIEQFTRFTAYIQYKDKNSEAISFRDSACFLGREEDYKSRIAEDARKELNVNTWKESWIGTGKISEYVKRAVGKCENLVNMHQQIDFRNRLDIDKAKHGKEAERVLYDIYRNPLSHESAIFEKAVKVFGAKYDIIAFLFFIKDDTRFLPISTSHFDKSFELLGIDYITSRKCSWENYQGYVNIIAEIRDAMESMLEIKGTPRLIDAHSFVWIVQQEEFINWKPESDKDVKYSLIDVKVKSKSKSAKSENETKGKIVYVPNFKAEEAKKITGAKGEDIVKEYLSEHKKELDINTIRDFTKGEDQDDGKGYDYSYTTNDGKEIYVEVKSTKQELGDNILFYMSANEYYFMKAHEDNYYIFFIDNVYDAKTIKRISAKDIGEGEPFKYKFSFEITDKNQQTE